MVKISYPYQSFAGISLPILAVLMVAVSRTIFLTYPLRWRDYLGAKEQIASFVCCIIFAIFISCIPFVGICSLANVHGKCVLDKEEVTPCQLYFHIHVTACYIAPILLVITLYVYMLRFVSKAKKNHESLKSSQSGSATTDSGISLGYKTERRSYPWSILIILLLNMLSVIPWFVITVLNEEIHRNSLNFYSRVAVDIAYSLMFVSMAISPMIYINSY